MNRRDFITLPGRWGSRVAARGGRGQAATKNCR
jgi:hypothetical protein